MLVIDTPVDKMGHSRMIPASKPYDYHPELSFFNAAGDMCSTDLQVLHLRFTQPFELSATLIHLVVFPQTSQQWKLNVLIEFPFYKKESTNLSNKCDNSELNTKSDNYHRPT